MKHQFFIYLRASTKRQEISGLGLQAQKSICEAYLKNIPNVSICGEATEIESGRVNNRPALMEAIATCKANGATLLVAKLDRLSRSVSFISTLMESKVKFVACDIPQANELTIHLFSAMAQFERKRISERICDALQAKKLREPDWKPGTNNLSDKDRQNGQRTNFMNARNDKAVRHAYHFIKPLKEQGYSYKQMADMLNNEGYRTRQSKSFHAQQVWTIVKRFQQQEVEAQKRSQV